MVKVRQDAWSHEDDLLLAETVLRHIREGSTQLNAFEEVGDQLNRTSAACGFRWNAEIRNKYNSAIDLAKRQRKEKKRAMQTSKQTRTKQVIQPVSTENLNNSSTDTEQTQVPHTFDSVIAFLSKLKTEFNQSHQSKLTLDQTIKENEALKQKVAELEKQLSQTEKQLDTIQEDYQVFIQIMERARKMTVFDDQGNMPPPKFRMDKNGNLEQVADGPS